MLIFIVIVLKTVFTIVFVKTLAMNKFHEILVNIE